MTSGLKFRWHRDFLASDLGKAAKLVGVRVWDYASGDGGGAHPGRSVLSKDLGISLSTVDRALRDCRDSGWLKRTNESNSHPSRAWADVYALTFPDRSSPVTTDQGINHSSSMTTDSADRSSNDTDQSSNEALSVVTDDDPTEPDHQNLLHESALSYVSNAGASVHERENESAATPTSVGLFDGLFERRSPKRVERQDYVDAEVIGDDIRPYEPAPEPPPLEWISLNLAGLSPDEAITAETMLNDGKSRYAVQQHIRLARKPGIRPRKHIHPSRDASTPLNGAEIPTATAEKSTA